MSVIMILPDLHCPIMHKDAVKFLKEVKKEYQPDQIVSVGDEVDFHNGSKWLKEPDAPGIDDEIQQAISQLQPIYKMFPELMVCTSNHTFRYAKRAYEAGLSRKMVKHIRDILEAPEGWNWKDRWVIDNTMFMHGELFGGNLLKLIELFRMNIVIGHAHGGAGIAYSNNGRSQEWGMNVGCLIDAESYGMRYAKAFARQPVLGCGLIIDNMPVFVPMQ